MCCKSSGSDAGHVNEEEEDSAMQFLVHGLRCRAAEYRCDWFLPRCKCATASFSARRSRERCHRHWRSLPNSSTIPRDKLGSVEVAPAAPDMSVTQSQPTAQHVTERLSNGAQDQADHDPTSQHAGDKETDKDSSGLVRLDALDYLLIACVTEHCVDARQVLPLARIKRIIKSEGDVKAVSSEASFAVARAAVGTADSESLQCNCVASTL